MASHLKGVAKSTMLDQIRKEFCEYKRDNPTSTQKDLQRWLEGKFELKVSQGTISNTLKRSDDYLSAEIEKGRAEIKRHKPAKYPDMEKVVYEWFLQHQEPSYVARNLDESTFDEETLDLKTMVNQCGYRNKMDIDNLMNYPGENEACSEVQSLEDIMSTIIENNVEDDGEDDTVSLEPVTRKEALMASNTLHNFMIQYKNTTPELLDAIRKVRDELQIDLNFKGKQTTIESYFNRV
ncbi:ARS-binding protein 1 [Glycine soja]